ncbi:MAG: TraB/GumN family protein [Deltaproteobacteria bacterium]|nr:MAG: TraB/GumN family protein [Deltaproteobacteria bacterium]
MTETTATTNYSGSIRRLTLDGREIILLGTAHVSQASVDMVRSVIADEQPDTVCVELDHQRHKALRNPNHWETLNLIEVIRQGQAPFLCANLALSAYQKRMGLHTGVRPGAELAAAAEEAESRDLTVRLIDREIRTTLLRAWRKAGFWKKMSLLATLLAGMFEKQTFDEEELARLRESDTLTVLLDELAEVLPTVKTILVDERDLYMANEIRHAPGQRIVAVVGAAHLPGISARLAAPSPPPEVIAELSVIPEPGRFGKMLQWLIPAIVVAIFVIGFFAGDMSKLSSAALGWVLATGSLSALATALAMGHPLTILSAFIAAPITTLHPAIGVGFVTALVQAFLVAPTVKDMERVGEEIATWRGWWHNRMTRVLLVFFFSNLGAALGVVLAFRWLKDLL